MSDNTEDKKVAIEKNRYNAEKEEVFKLGYNSRTSTENRINESHRLILDGYNASQSVDIRKGDSPKISAETGGNQSNRQTEPTQQTSFKKRGKNE